MYNKPNPKQKFYDLEKDILKFWKENDILNKSIQNRPDDKQRTFYDGPITANGMPHHGHMLTFAMKDIIPRYWTMKGYKVDRSLGWDCQGIPVEYEIEKKLGFKEKKDIEKFGIAKFNQLCRESVLEFKDKIVELEEKMGRLTNTDEEYFTMDSQYIESVWSSLKQIYDKGLLYEGFKVVPYSTRAGTTLSNAEVALGGYKKIVDPAITVEFPLVEDEKTVLLAWTTTPWTMPGNLGLAVGAKIDYVKVKVEGVDKTYVVAKDLVESVFKDKTHEVVGPIAVADLIGKEYKPPFDYYKGRKGVHQIYEGGHVTTESGTGIVHLAPYGAEDNDIFIKVGIESFDYLNDQGDFTDAIPEYAGKFYKQANPMIVQDLTTKGVLFDHSEYEHDMPMCWRTNTPLIYKPIKSWYIAMSTLRKELVENNNKINWMPKHVKEGRFGNWLAEIKDWGISRTRYWGTPLPIWKSETGKLIMMGSFADVEKYTGKKVDDPHRPYIDDFNFEFEGENYVRIPDVIDVWYDSGAMPYARLHYPFENEDKLFQKYPAQYIAESVDQTRGWFYSLHAISTALFNKPAFENVVMSGFVLDDKGVKLSKSKGNYTAPDSMIEEFGADAIRLNFFSTPICAGEDTTITPKTLKILTQDFVLPIWNIFSYLTTYSNIHEWHPTEQLAYNKRNVTADTHPWDHIPFDNMTNSLDAWIILKLQQAIKEVTESLDTYEIQRATKAIRDLFDHISKWYIRSNRERFAEGDPSAINTLYYVFVEALKLLSPLAPFISEYIYRELVVSEIDTLPESIHLNDFPEYDKPFAESYGALEYEMDFARKITEMGHELRVSNGLKVRQPLTKLVIQTDNDKVAIVSDWMRTLLQKELNVLSVEDTIKMQSSSTLKVSEDDGLKVKVGLDLEITPELKEKGMLREISRQIQATRKSLNFEMGDKVKILYYTENSELKDIIEKNKDSIFEATNTVSLEFKEGLETPTEAKIEENILFLKLENA
ncbi:MAG: isoleucine--tRNA ligase [Candidatus Dojkabacteria bacterium]